MCYYSSPPPPSSWIMSLWSLQQTRGVRGGAQNHITVFYCLSNETPRKKYHWSREYWMMYRGSNFLAVPIIELPPPINNVSLELISARGDGGGAKIIYPRKSRTQSSIQQKRWVRGGDQNHITVLLSHMKHQGKNINDPENIEWCIEDPTFWLFPSLISPPY